MMKTNKLFKRITTILSKEIDYIIVGGYAQEINVTPTGSIDIDIIVIPKNYDNILEKIPFVLNKHNIYTRIIDNDLIMSLFETRINNETIELEVINSLYYTTKKHTFYDYVKQYRSSVKGNTRFADPELVWYMRLYLPYWETYMYKCLRKINIAKNNKYFDLNKTLNNILGISKVFGTYKKLKPRVDELKKHSNFTQCMCFYITKNKMIIDQLMIVEGYISINKHPELNLWLYNYTPKTQYNRMWNDTTTKCRGLILNNEEIPTNNPFPKFFNLNETEETMIENLPNGTPEIIDKLDGFLGIMYNWNNKPAITTRGVFTSPMAKWATKWIQERYSIDDFNPDYTYLYEIIMPNKELIINYEDREELVLLAVRHNNNGHEIDNIKEALDILPNLKGNEKEGFVIKYPNNLRLKIKCEDYKRLHKLMSSLSKKKVINTLLDYSNVDELIKDVPDEFYKEVHKLVDKVNVEKEQIMHDSIKIFKQVKDIESKKERAKKILLSKYPGVVFALLDDNVKKAEMIILKKIKKK